MLDWSRRRDEATRISSATAWTWICLFCDTHVISTGINKVLAKFSGRELTFMAFCWKTLKNSLQAIIGGVTPTSILLCFSCSPSPCLVLYVQSHSSSAEKPAAPHHQTHFQLTYTENQELLVFYLNFRHGFLQLYNFFIAIKCIFVAVVLTSAAEFAH